MKKPIAIITIIIGIIVMILGLTIEVHDVGSYNVSGASFGADFYTYVYDGVDTIVDELDDINRGVETIASAGKMIVISIGLLIVVMGLKQLPGDPTTVNVTQPVSYIPTDPSSPTALQGGWLCSCGANHFDTETCSCGKTKEEALGENSPN